MKVHPLTPSYGGVEYGHVLMWNAVCVRHTGTCCPLPHGLEGVQYVCAYVVLHAAPNVTKFKTSIPFGESMLESVQSTCVLLIGAVEIARAGVCARFI